ncbi:hypothetical protein L1276_000088 [Flavobacterium sp. HSC-32F16]|uniref:hypothetical protein n=1 Tax=Flavobacterium sp. HSC-32F16 TaxID=2910964 RepID=UPI0020A3213F|nr:hypothetical protein [Flavobacterium sp. HSC-32F16]MCP2024948.1 hypothetical protein [Flavobacterium sp. HSC-32F16]
MKNEYVKANHLAKHIHLFNHEISGVDYASFGELRGNICRISEKQNIHNETAQSGFEVINTIYNFNKNLELYQLLIDKNGFEESILFFDSLKAPQIKQIRKSFNNKVSSQTEVFYTDYLEFKTIEEHTYYNGEISKWVNPNQGDTKYHFKENGSVYKFRIRNNRDEQSKTTIIYNSDFQILESKTYSQKNKTELLYEAVFSYVDNVLFKIVYIRHKPSKSLVASTYEFLFEYDKKGLLISFKDNFVKKTWNYDKNENPVLIKETPHNDSSIFETSMKYKYDKYNNWIYKEIKLSRNQLKISEKKIFREIEYFHNQKKT